jgi:hypothetical protein
MGTEILTQKEHTANPTAGAIGTLNHSGADATVIDTQESCKGKL